MAALESQANYALTDIDYTTPAPAMAAATPSQTQFIVLFDFDSVDYAPGNGTIVREALDAALASAGSALRVRSEARRGGRECGRTCRSRWAPGDRKKKKQQKK